MKILVLVEWLGDIPQYVESEDRYSVHLRLAVKPDGTERRFVVVGADGTWVQKLNGQVFDAVENLNLAPDDLLGFVLSRVRSREEEV